MADGRGAANRARSGLFGLRISLERFRPPVLAFVAYLGLSIVVFGRGTLLDPAGTIVGGDGSDKTIVLWGFAWLPHALAEPTDPLSTALLWAPGGTDLAWVAWTPGAALVALPVTLLAGPVPAYNILAVAAPALAGAAAYLLARELSATPVAALVGGFLFGFSSFVTVHTAGHLHMTLVFLLPVIGLLVLRRLRGRLTRRAFVLALAIVLAAQGLFSTEILLGALIAGALVMGIAWFRLYELHPELRRTGVESAVAIALAAVLLSPLLVHALAVAGPESQPRRSPFSASADVANLVVPVRRTLVRPPGSNRVVDRFRASGAERTAYLGLPLIIAVVGFAISRIGRARAGSVLSLSVAAMTVCAFGPRIRFAGVTLLPGPWAPIAHVPVLAGVKPARLTVFVALLAALAASLWLSGSAPLALRAAVAAAAILTLVPDPSERLWKAEVPRSSFFASDVYKEHIGVGDEVIVLPYGPTGWSMLWQAETDFRFRLVGGHIGRRTTIAEEPWEDVYRALQGGSALPPPPNERILAFLGAHRVDAIVVVSGTRAASRRLVASLGLPWTSAGDARIYEVPSVGAMASSGRP